MNFITFYIENTLSKTYTWKGDMFDLTTYRLIPKDIRRAVHKALIATEHIDGSIMRFFPKLEKVIVDDSVRSIGDNVFRDCKTLKSVILPYNLETIGNGAFAGCSSLKAIDLPSGVKKLGKEAFSMCFELSEINATGVTMIGKGCFSYCHKLKEIDILIASLSRIAPYCFYHCEAIEHVHFSKTLTHIGDYAFSYCRALKTIDLPDSLRFIYEAAFENSGLLELRLPEHCRVFAYAFRKCESLTKLEIMTRYPFILYNTKTKTYIYDPETIRKFKSKKSYNIWPYAFCQMIECFAFEDCCQLSDIPDIWTMMPNFYDVFRGCPLLDLQHSSTLRELASFEIPGTFHVHINREPYMHQHSGRLFLADKGQHILLEWDAQRKSREFFIACVPKNFGEGKLSNLRLLIGQWDLNLSKHYDTRYKNLSSALRVQFTYTLEHDGVYEEITKHGFIGKDDYNYAYVHRVYLEKGYYVHNSVRFVRNSYEEYRLDKTQPHETVLDLKV